MNVAAEDLRFRITRFDTQIKMEFDLIGYRMMWLMTSQAFLFAAFSVCVTANTPRLPEVTRLLQYVLPIVGSIAAFVVALAILAAHRVVERLKPARTDLERMGASLGYEILGVDPESPEHVSGNLPSRILPPIIAVAWLALLIVVCRS
jgi:glucan phosphoethanolaminetransferase (alkaline phosphatase superfamily)